MGSEPFFCPRDHFNCPSRIDTICTSSAFGASEMVRRLMVSVGLIRALNPKNSFLAAGISWIFFSRTAIASSDMRSYSSRKTMSGFQSAANSDGGCSIVALRSAY